MVAITKAVRYLDSDVIAIMTAFSIRLFLVDYVEHDDHVLRDRVVEIVLLLLRTHYSCAVVHHRPAERRGLPVCVV